ncbi:helix-turn-helix domain-containing protein [Hoeflea sp. WL0058]|uniref:Helix-turn-helix domain-containing protein n=1 Tax=Flavimaribacter sediminis TaxID=2865987 RepID=A0AAE3D0B3_9HYPH|nr:helix-turn-helix transcriptional regulator [Flavimaribacter sediminis]MBW8637479.1 helix-turn-helix domain-containing protein [Flavimaribacter sediminis]
MSQIPPLRAGRIGGSLRRWRVLNKVKQSALAADVGVSQTTISRWESGALLPEKRHVGRIVSLLTARPVSAADSALLELVSTSAERVHLVCDVSHRLLAASPSRAEDWRDGVAGFLGKSLWRYASKDIVTAEQRLGEDGWDELIADDVEFATERIEHPELVIRAGRIRWTRIALSDGSFARLVRDGPCKLDA